MDRDDLTPPPGRRFVTVGLVVLFALGSALVGAVIVVRGRLLDAGTYTAALVRTGAIPKLGGTTFEPEEVIDAIMDALGPRADDELRRQVTAAVLADDERDALITAGAVLVADHATAAAERLQAGAEDGRRLDVVAAVAEHPRQPAASVVASLDGVRDAARWLRPLAAIVGAIVMAAAAGALAWRDRPDPCRAATVVAIALVAAGVANLALWWVVARIVAPPLERATGTGPGTWKLPPALRALLADVQHAVADDLAGTVRRYAGVLVATGAALGAGIVIGPRVRGLRPSAAVAVVGGAAAAVAVVATIAATNVGTSPPRACNGHAELCDRRYDEVAHAATHNSMSSPDIVPVWPEHDGDLAAQLDAGVRALLIDTHYWPPVAAAGNLSAALDPTETAVPPALTDAWYDTLGALRDGREGAFLCHIQCAFGAIELVDAR